MLNSIENMTSFKILTNGGQQAITASLHAILHDPQQSISNCKWIQAWPYKLIAKVMEKAPSKTLHLTSPNRNIWESQYNSRKLDTQLPVSVCLETSCTLPREQGLQLRTISNATGMPQKFHCGKDAKSIMNIFPCCKG